MRLHAGRVGGVALEQDVHSGGPGELVHPGAVGAPRDVGVGKAVAGTFLMPAMPDTRAALTTAGAGGNTRFSTKTDSIADVGALMVLSPGLMELELGGTVGRGTYKPLTGTKLTESATPRH